MVFYISVFVALCFFYLRAICIILMNKKNLRLSLPFTLLVGGPSAPIAAVLLAGHTPAVSAGAAPLATQKATAPNAALVASNQQASYWALDRVFQ